MGLDTSAILRFCPVCITKGFHTPLFQIKTVVECPIHGKPLQDLCPGCRYPIYYSLSDKLLREPYGCPCRTTLWWQRGKYTWSPGITAEEGQVIQNYIAWQKPLGRYPGKQLWSLALQSSSGDSGDGVEMARVFDLDPLEGWRASAFRRHPGTIQSGVTGGQGIPAFPVTLRDRRDRIQITEVAKVRHEQFFHGLLDEYYTIYKSVRRHLKRRYLSKHRLCLQLARTATMRSWAMHCPCSSAYYEWVKDWDSPFADSWYRKERWARQIEERAGYWFDVAFSINPDGDLSEEHQQFLTWIGARWLVLTLLDSLLRLCSNNLVPGVREPSNSPCLYWEPANASTSHTLTWWAPPVLEVIAATFRPDDIHRRDAKKLRVKIEEAKERNLAPLPRL